MDFKKKGQKIKFYSEVSSNNDSKDTLNDTFQKKKKKTHIFSQDNDWKNSDNEGLNKSENAAIKLRRKKKHKRIKLKKWDKDIPQNETGLNSNVSIKNTVLTSEVINKNKSMAVSVNSSRNGNIVLSGKDKKSDRPKDSISSLSMKRKKKKLRNKNNLQQNATIPNVIPAENLPKLNVFFKELGKNKEIDDFPAEKDKSFMQDIACNSKECLGIDSTSLTKKKRLKRKKRHKMLLQDHMSENSPDLALFQGNNVLNPSEENEKELDISCEEMPMRKCTLFQSKAYQKLQAAKFRYLNEMLYTSTGKNALKYFQQNVDEFQDYHAGYQLQVSKWPLNPVDVIIKELRQTSKQSVIVDLGCGEAKIAQVLSNRIVHSFDLIALKDCVTACDIANVPLPDKSVDVAVFCLSLMGTTWKDYLLEAHRILKLSGTLKIAEIESRIENLNGFIKYIELCGFALVNKNLSHRMFIFLNFKKVKKNAKSSKVKDILLKPCLYKKR